MKQTLTEIETAKSAIEIRWSFTHANFLSEGTENSPLEEVNIIQNHYADLKHFL